MNIKTVWRAKTIFKRGGVMLCKDSEPPSFYHFLVRQRSGAWTDVWYEKKNGAMEWNCNSVDKSGKFGCVMFVKVDRTKPYCSHTLACKILLKNQEAK